MLKLVSQTGPLLEGLDELKDGKSQEHPLEAAKERAVDGGEGGGDDSERVVEEAGDDEAKEDVVADLNLIRRERRGDC